MDEVCKLINQYKAAITEYDLALPVASPRQRMQILAHRAWDLAIIADIRRLVREVEAGASRASTGCSSPTRLPTGL